MGTFLDYIGNKTIPEEKKQEFCERVLKVFDVGGMMGIDTVSLFGKKVALLHRPEKVEDDFGKESRVPVQYNYFESWAWEPAGLNLTKTQVYSNKVGWSCFNLICRAAYLLQEFYAEGYGLYTEDGRVLPSRALIGWLNGLFDEWYTNERVKDPWSVCLLLHEAKSDWYYDASYFKDASNVLEESPDWMDWRLFTTKGFMSYRAAYSPDFSRWQNSEGNGTGDMDVENEEDISPVKAAQWLRDSLRRLDANGGESRGAKLNLLKTLIRSDPGARETLLSKAEQAAEFARFARLADHLPVPVAVRLTADQFDADFWELYRETGGQMPDLRLDDDDPVNKPQPIEKVSTEEFLHVTGDDRAYWWREGGDVCFSSEMTDWLDGLRQEIDRMENEGAPYDDGVQFQKALFDTLERLGDDFGILMFRESFYDLMANWQNVRKQALLVILHRLYDQDKPCEATTNMYGMLWLHNFEERKKHKWLRRFLAVIGNAKLRQSALGA